MSYFGWIILGLIAGYIASKFIYKTGQGMVINLALGIVGAVVGGYLATNVLGWGGVTAWYSPYSILISTIGAVIVLWVYGKVTGANKL
jgi:uncharacterized membrane protein YeaQ/YmgE (transglycosylase-associated protein family)